MMKRVHRATDPSSQRIAKRSRQQEIPLIRRRKDDSDDEKQHPTVRSGNNQYGAIGTDKCYQCRLKKLRVRSDLKGLIFSACTTAIILKVSVRTAKHLILIAARK
jgi:hypothetical protein